MAEIHVYLLGATIFGFITGFLGFVGSNNGYEWRNSIICYILGFILVMGIYGLIQLAHFLYMLK